MTQHHMRRKRAITISRTTTTIIIIASCAAAALFSLLLSIWLYRRHRRRQRASTSTRGDYKKLQKRNKSRSPQPSLKHLSLSTTRESSRRHSSISIPKYQKQALLDLEAQHTEYQSHSRSQDSTHPRPNTSPSSVYSFNPEHLSKGPFTTPQVQVHIHPDTSNSKTPVPAPAPDTNAPAAVSSRNPSTRVKNYHTNAEYSTLIVSDVQTLTANMPLPPPPPIPRKSSRRSSEPTSIDSRLAASMRREAGLSVSRQSGSGQRMRSMEPVGRCELAA